MKKLSKIISILLIVAFSLTIIISTVSACTNYSQSKNFYYGTYTHTPSVSWTFNLCNGGSYFNTAKSWWYDYSSVSNSGWILKYFEGSSANYSSYYCIIGYSIAFWTPGAWGQITDFNTDVPPYAILDTNRIALISDYQYPHYGSGSFGQYYTINFTTLTSDSTNYTIYQEVYPYSW